GLADVDAAMEVGELQFGAAAVDGSVNRLVDLDAIFAAMPAAILDGLLRVGGLELNIEIAKDVSAIGLQAEVCFQVGGEGHINIAIQRTEGHGFLIDTREGHQNAPIQSVRDGVTGDVVQRDRAVHVVDVQFAVHTGHHDVPAIHGAQLERSMHRNENRQVD